MVAFGAGPVLLDLVLAIGPPWPTRTGVASFTSVMAWVVLLYSFAVWESIARYRLRSLIRTFAPLCACTLTAYLLLSALFVVDAPDPRNQEAKGFLLQDDIRKVVSMTEETPLTLLEGNRWDPTSIWVPWTVATVRFSLLVMWIAFFACFSFMVSVFVLHQYKRRV